MDATTDAAVRESDRLAQRAVELATALGALADPVRLQMLSIIAGSPDGEVCACDFVDPVGRSQPTVSHHLKVLADAGLVVGERRGRWIWYRVRHDGVHAVTNGLARALDGSLHAGSTCC